MNSKFPAWIVSSHIITDTVEKTNQVMTIQGQIHHFHKLKLFINIQNPITNTLVVQTFIKIFRMNTPNTSGVWEIYIFWIIQRLIFRSAPFFRQKYQNISSLHKFKIWTKFKISCTVKWLTLSQETSVTNLLIHLAFSLRI